MTPRLLLAFILTFASAICARSQTVVFNDTFGAGSSVNSSPTSPAAPLINKSAYQQIAAKTFSPNPPTIASGHLRYGIAGTSSGFNSIEALFTQYPVTLANTGEYVELTVTFTNQAGILTANANGTLMFALHNGSQIQPVPGGLNATSDTYASAGNAQTWAGYISRILYTGANHQICSRAAQGAVARDQDVLYNFNNPSATTIGSLTVSALGALTTGAQYTEVFRITKTAAAAVTIVSSLYQGADATGTQLFTQSVVSSSIPVSTFDALGIGYRHTGSVASVMDVNSIKVVTTASTTVVPVITTHPVSQTLNAGDPVTFSVVASGGGAALTYQWKKDGTNISGATSSNYSIASTVTGDGGSYTVVVTDAAGSTTSNAATLTVATGNVAPTINSHPSSSTVLSGAAASFSCSFSGTAPLSAQWQKSTDNGANYSNVSSASATSPATYSITSTVLSDAGLYRLVVTNAYGTATSNAATLTVNQAPTITTQPVGSIVASGAGYTLSASFNVGSPAPTYQWQIGSDGVTFANVSGATSASLALTGAAVTSGYYRVIATNVAGSVTSSTVYFGIPSTQSVTFAPGNNATGISIDQQLRLVFPSAPKLGLTGVVRILDAADDTIVATIDRSQFVSYVPGNTSVTAIPNAAIRTLQGSTSGTGTGTVNYYYMPIAVYGNEVWITLSPTQRLSYGRTYYVTMDSALLLDSTNAAYMGISGSTTWRFSTKASGPATPTASTGLTSITIGQDGAGDFASFQGAFDWIPQNNTLARSVVVKPGIYRDSATLAQNRNFITIVGESSNRTAAQLIYPFAYFAPPATVFTAGSLRIESSDVAVRDLTVDNIIYNEYHPTGSPSSGAPGAFAGAINTVATTGKRIVFDNVLIKGGQDTLYDVIGIAYFYNCEIWGSVDFIYGQALAVFDQCNIVEIRNVGGPVGAPNTVYAQPYGLVFLNCAFPRALVANGYPYDVNTGSTTFMRPWGQDGMTAIINCSIGTQFSAARWLIWDGRENTCRAREYGTTLIGGGALSPGTAYWNNTIDPDYTVSTMSPTDPLLVSPGGITNRTAVTVDPADYTLAAIFGHAYFNLSSWLPSLIPRITTQPISQTVNPGQSVTFSVAATGAPTPTYQWYKDNVAIGGATSNSYTIASASAADWASYKVTVTNSVATLTSSIAALTVNDPVALWANGYGLNPSTTGARTADPDGDSVTNLMEFAFGMDPTVNSTGVLTISGATLTSHGLPVVDVETLPTVVNYTARFVRRKDWQAAGLTYSVQFSADLNTWETSTAPLTFVAQDATHEVISVPYPFTVNHRKARFFRVVVTAQ